MTKHTAGPWVVAEDVFNGRPEIRDRDGRLIAVVMAHYPMSATTQSANARLIAAAPELLEALKWLNAEFECRDNVWHGLTVCNQDEADEKIPTFLQVPGKKFLIIEPMLGAVDLWAINDGSWWDSEGATRYNALTGSAWWGSTGEHGLGGGPTIDAVILGGETGPGARPMHPAWVRSVRDQCAAAGVPFFFKSWGKYKGPMHPSFTKRTM